ncbi:RALF 34 [Spatholobus suberectus]|nr:RALF 34 [Spatholobus suberectus]
MRPFVPCPSLTPKTNITNKTPTCDFTLHSLLMASSLALLNLAFTFLLYITLSLEVGMHAQIEETSFNLMSNALEWPTTMSLYNDVDKDNVENDLHLILGDLTTSITTTRQETLFTLTLGAALPSRAARDEFRSNKVENKNHLCLASLGSKPILTPGIETWDALIYILRSSFCFYL